MKAREIIEKLQADGWVIVRQKSSHRTLKKTGVRAIITVPGRDNQEVSIGVLADIRRISGIDLR